jgi:hypothetical protein
MAAPESNKFGRGKVASHELTWNAEPSQFRRWLRYENGPLLWLGCEQFYPGSSFRTLLRCFELNASSVINAQCRGERVQLAKLFMVVSKLTLPSRVGNSTDGRYCVRNQSARY